MTREEPSLETLWFKKHKGEGNAQITDPSSPVICLYMCVCVCVCVSIDRQAGSGWADRQTHTQTERRAQTDFLDR
jgi:hypothetical protein